MLPLLADLVATMPALPHAHATRIERPPVLDGRLDEAVWQRAIPERVFTQKYPNERSAPSEPTSFRLLYDDDALYVGIDCTQKKTPIVARLTRRDREVEADRVEVALDSRGEGRSAYELTVNAAGVLADSIRFNDTEEDEDWDETWDARVAETDHGWSVEMRIPLRILRFSSAREQPWRLQVRRYTSLLQETDEWSFIGRAEAGEVSRYGFVDGVRNLKPTAFVELRPFGLIRIERRDPGTETLGSGTSVHPSAGLDLKWHATPDLALDLTVNPDFAQVEADKLVLNLTNYEIELPEKRPFFLEGRDVFTTPMPLLYTRRIGRVAPPPPALNAGEALVDPTSPAAIAGAEKLVGRLGPRTSIGVLTALSAQNAALVRDARQIDGERLVEARTLFHALRLKREILKNAHVGLMLTSAMRGEDTRAYVRAEDGAHVLCPQGDLVLPGRRCFHDAYVGAADARWRSDDGAWAVTSQLAGSAIREGPTRTLRDGTRIGTGDLGLGGKLKIAKEGGVPWVGDVTYEGAGRKLDFNDVGYMRRQNLHALEANLEYRTLEPWFVTIETHSRFEFFARRNLDGLRLAEGYQLNTSWRFPSFWEVFIEVHHRARYYDDREIGDGTALERGGLLGLEVEVESDPRKKIAFELTTQTQKIFDGFAFHGTALAIVRVLPQLEITVGPESIVARNEPRFTARNGDALVFGRLDAENLGGTMRVTYTITPRLSIQSYTQLFVAAGRYRDFSRITTINRIIDRDLLEPGPPPSQNPDFVDAAVNGNVVLRWEYMLGSTLYVVYTRVQSPRIQLLPGQSGVLDFGGIGRAAATDTILVKASHFF